MLAVDPWKPVTVDQPDGSWEGWLLAWRRDEAGAWRAYVRYSRAPGMQHQHWISASEVRPAGLSACIGPARARPLTAGPSGADLPPLRVD
jgi:hypothetical protein